MRFHRVKQMYKAITARITIEDKKYVKKYLNNEELKFFNKLSKSEKKHAINVSKSIMIKCKNKKINMDENSMIKIGLLHDIGKIYTRLSIIDKSILVILNRISKGKIKKIKKIKKIDVYYNHAEKGYNLLKEYDYDEKFLSLIKNHHSKGTKDYVELKILKKSDNEN